MTGKSHLALGDFTIAAKTVVPADNGDAVERPVVSTTVSEHPDNVATPPEALLAKRPVAEREKKTRERAIAQEEARYSLKNLKRAKQREVKFFVNVALDQATKSRLKRAADENDIKMATVMKAAIDFYLTENGY